jgi:hypothetical protein
MSQLTELQWESLVEAIRQEKCMLFIGPDATINYGDANRQSDFLKELTSKNPDSILAYHDSDGLLVFDDVSSKDQFYRFLREFYQQPIPNPLLQKLALIPWHVAITVTPDLALNAAFSGQGLEYSHHYYVTKTQNTLKEHPTKERPLLYNLLGCVLQDESLITSHFDLFDTIQSILADKNLPPEIVNMLGSAQTRNVVFLGFQFDKWYYQLLLYLLQLKSNLKGRLAASVMPPEQLDQLVLSAQYKINFISGDLESFIDALLSKFSPAELRKPQPKKVDTKAYKRGNIFKMLQNGFDPVAFETFCFSNFPEVQIEFAPGQTHGQRVNLLLTHCETTGTWEELLSTCEVQIGFSFQQYGPYVAE